MSLGKLIVRIVNVRNRQRRCLRLDRALHVVVIAIAMAATWLCSAASAAVVTPSSCLHSMAQSSQVREICTDSLPLASTTEIRFGGTEYNYIGPNGQVVSLTVPSPSFNSATASPAELREAGVPPEPPKSSPEYPKWHAMIEAGIHFATPPKALAERVEQLPASSSNATGQAGTAPPPTQEQTFSAEHSENWSGYFEWNGKGNFTKADAYYKEPAKKRDACEEGGNETKTGIWAGLGGNYEGAALAQDGTELGNAKTVHENEAWFEVPNGEPHLPKYVEMPVFPEAGDWVQADVQYQGHEEFTFFVENMKTGEAGRGIGHGKLDGNVSDFIVERVGEYGLVDFGDVRMQGFTNNKAFAEHPEEIQRETMRNNLKKVNAGPTTVINHYEFYDNYGETCFGEGLGNILGEAEGVPPTAATEPATSVGSSSATLNGTVNPEGHEAHYSFEYGTEEYNYSNSTPELSTGNGSSPVKVTGAVTGLSPGTTYHYRIIVDGETGIVAGADHTFTTTGTPPPPPPSVEGLTASDIGAHAATLEATVNPNGTDTHYYFEYGVAPGLYEQDAPAEPGTDIGSGTSGVPVAVGIDHLLANTTYYYRVVATNSTGTTYAPEKEFHTKWAWLIQPTVNPKGLLERDKFAGVSCWAPSECVAVGHQDDSEGRTATLAERWNGSEWTLQTTANPSGVEGSNLEAVSCTSASECTATGYYEASKGKHYSLAERWNGSTWTVESTPTFGSDTNLDGVSCASSKECVAVGWYVEEAMTLPVVEKWNEKKWTSEKAAKLPAEDTQAWLYGVSCPAAKKCEAVGSFISTSLNVRALAESMSDSTWTQQSIPTAAHTEGVEPRGVSCSSTSACTAVGGLTNNTTHKGQSFTARWNGTEWVLESGLDPVTQPEYESEASWQLSSVSCPGSSACMAVGYYSEGSKGTNGLLGEYWNGSTWGPELPENRTGVEQNVLDSVSCGSATVCTSVGYSEISATTSRTLAEQLTEP